MQSITPTRPMNGNFYEAVQTLRPHPKIRPVSAPAPETRSRQNTATPKIDQWCVPSGTTVVDKPETPHLYTSRRQYEAATRRKLGSLSRLDTDTSPKTAGSMSPTYSPLSPRSMIGRAKALLSPRSSDFPKSSEGEKVHGAFCRTKSAVMNSLRRSKNGGLAEARSRDPLRSGFYSASDERLFMREDDEETGESETSTISHEPPQIAPLWPVSKFLPDLTISIPDNEVGHTFVIEHNSIKDDGEVEGDGSNHDNLRVAPLRPHSPNVTPASRDDATTAETSFYTAGETSFYYTPNVKEDDDVFTTPSQTSQTEPLMKSFMAKLQDAMEPNRGYKNPSIASTIGSTGSPVVTPSPSPKLRHTALQPKRGMQSDSLRTQYNETEIASTPPDLSVPKMWQLTHKESTRNLRVAPSLEKGLHAEDLEVFEENALAAAAPIVHRIELDVVDVRRLQAIEIFEQQDPTVSNHQQSDRDLEVAPLSVAPKPTSSRESNVDINFSVPTLPFEILHTIVFSAAYGDEQCRTLVSALYQELTEAQDLDAEPQWDGRKQRLLLQLRLLQELETLKQYGFLRDDVFAVIRGQMFPTITTEMLSNRDFTKYIHRSVSGYALAEEWAGEILGLALDEEDENFAQCSPEEEVLFQREPFDPEGFVYDASSDDGCYERLRSLPSTVGTFEPEEPQPQRQSGWRTSFLSKFAQMFRFGHLKRMS